MVTPKEKINNNGSLVNLGTNAINTSKAPNKSINVATFIIVMFQKVSEICFFSAARIEILRVPVIEKPRSEKIIKIVETDCANITSPKSSMPNDLTKKGIKISGTI